MCVSPWDIGVSYRYLSAAQEALKMFDIRKPKRQDGKCLGKSVGVYIGWLNLNLKLNLKLNLNLKRFLLQFGNVVLSI